MPPVGTKIEIGIVTVPSSPRNGSTCQRSDIAPMTSPLLIVGRRGHL